MKAGRSKWRRRSFDDTSGLIALFAVATALTLQSERVFVSYLVFVVDQSERLTIALIALAVFAFPVTTYALRRLSSPSFVLLGGCTAIAIARMTLQFADSPVARLVAAAVIICAWGVIAVYIATVNLRHIGFGLVLGFGLDIASRSYRPALGLPWIPDLIASGIVTILVLLLLALAWKSRGLADIREFDLRSAVPLLALGPALALFHLVTGNIAFVAQHTGLTTIQAGLLLSGGVILGALIGTLRLIAIGAGAGMLASRFLIFDAIVGSLTLSLVWRGDELAALGALFSTVIATELILFIFASRQPPDVQPPTGFAAAFVTLGMLAHFVTLFVYYSSTGSGPVIFGIWALLLATGGVAIFGLPRSLSTDPIDVRPLLVPGTVIVAALAIAPIVATGDTGTAKPEPRANEPLAVMTYNIQSGFSRDDRWDLEATAKVIEESGATVVILQEVSRGWLVTSGNDQLVWLGDRLGMNYSWGPASTDGLWGNALLSNYPVQSSTVIRYSSTDNLRRSALVVDLLIDGETVRFVATHLDNPEDAGAIRSEQVEQLLPLVDEVRPLVLGGDFNMGPSDPLIQQIMAVGLTDAGAAGGATGATSATGNRIDYIFVSDEFAVVRADIIDSGASDHRPVIATLELP